MISPTQLINFIFIFQQLDQNLNSALMREADGQAHCYSETDLKIGLEAVKSKTTPQFPDYRTWKN